MNQWRDKLISRNQIVDSSAERYKKHHIQFLSLLAGVVVVVLFISTVLAPFLVSQFESNIGWLHLARVMAQQDSSSASPVTYFTNSIESGAINRRAYLGAGMAYAEALDEPNALSFWQQGTVSPDLLNQLGRQARTRGLRDVAFIYFRSAAHLEQAGLGEGHFLAGRLCQATLTDLTVLSAVNERYCQEYFANQSYNLVLDGQFEQEIAWGWSGESFFTNPLKAVISIDQTKGMPAPSLMLSGLTEERHTGIYQRIALEPGSEVRFSGYFRTENVSGLATWLLYVEWRADDKTHGTRFYTVESDMEWTYLEWIVTVPDDSDPWMNFYPVLLIGRGTVWSDNITVEVLSE